MPIDWNAPALPGPPPQADYSAISGAPQGKCVANFFGDHMTLLASSGMSVCSAVFLRVQLQDNVFGAAIHYDSTIDAGALFVEALQKFGVTQPKASMQTFLVFWQEPTGIACTGMGAYNDLTEAGFPEPVQFKHHGTAAMDAAGNVFDYSAIFAEESVSAPSSGKAKTKEKGCCVLQ